MAGNLIGRRKVEGRGPGIGATALRPMVFVFCLLSSVFCCAEELPDPTRPPAGILAPSATDGAEVAPAPAGLQSIIISRTRRAAIIGGETVELGGKYGDAKLIEVNEGSVVLRSAQGRQVMTLFPGVKVTATKAAAGNEMKDNQKTKPQTPEGKVKTGKQKADRAAVSGGEK